MVSPKAPCPGSSKWVLSPTSAGLAIRPIRDLPEIRAGDDLAQVLEEALGRCSLRLADGDVLVVAQKVVSKAEGRVVDLAGVEPSPFARAYAERHSKDARVVELVGDKVAHAARDAALNLYRKGRDYAAQRGIVIADTKFEFGLRDGQLLLIDECLTPDSSRFWPANEVRPGGTPTSFDKQYLRNWLLSTGWNKTPPPPTLPTEVIDKTRATYLEIQRRLGA